MQKSNNSLLTYSLNHLAIIMDGNRRYARAKKISPQLGHQSGANNLLKIIKFVLTTNIKEFSVFAFSTENWKRSRNEINYIFTTFEKYLIKHRDDFNTNGISVNIIGSRNKLNKSLVNVIEETQKLTAKNNKLRLNIMFNYGGLEDIEFGLKSLKNKTITGLKKTMLSRNVSNVDLLIRTGNEKRISNFLPLQLGYAELYFSKLNWPEFDVKQLKVALNDYKQRHRRYGGD